MKNTHVYCVLCACVSKKKSTNSVGKIQNEEKTASVPRVYIDGYICMYFVDFSVVHDVFKADQERVIRKSVNGQLPLRCQLTMLCFPVFYLK